jgi:alkylation response protein AidB-like acyl-CoA dehydrogenase
MKRRFLMDFSLPYTEEQEQFRQEVRSWLEENIPEEMKDPIDNRDRTSAMYDWWKEKRREIGAKGWLYPTFPTEYGGGGLTGDHETIIEEEFDRAKVSRIIFTPNFIFPALLVWGTEEQKERFLKPLVTGEQTCWYKMTEPQSGADLANIQTTAVRDGDDWVITGQNVFISGGTGPDKPDWLYGPAVTDPDAPRHRNMGIFMIPVPSEGLEIRQQNLLVGEEQHFLFLDKVRVPNSNLIGGEHQGWQVGSTSRENEHGGRGRAAPKDAVVDNLVVYAKETKQNGETLGKDPVVQQATMESYLDAHVQAILLKRTYGMYTTRQEVVYEGNLANVHGRESSLRVASRVRDVMNMSALLDTKEPGAPHGGAQEGNQRQKAGQNHGGGSTNIIKVILARRIGISRTKERPAVTPATAGISG